MALIYKNKNKKFRIRRKNIKWLNSNKPLFENQPLTISKYIWQNIYSKTKQKVNFLNKIYFLQDDVIRTSNWADYDFSINKNIFINFYIQYCSAFLKSRVSKNIENEYDFNLIVLSTPKTQLFFTLLTQKVFLVFTCGIIRLVMQLIDKCSKKKKIVILNGIKFMWTSALNKFKGSAKIKFKGNYNYIRPVFNKNSEESKFIDYIIYQPKLNFGFCDLPKRSSVKKKLRKKKKYKSE